MTKTCPPHQQLQALLEDDLPASVQAELALHLEQCAHCRAALDQLAAEGKSFADQARRLREEPGIPEPGLRRVLDQATPNDANVTEADISGDANQELPPLAPPRKPGNLGRLDHYEVISVIGKGGFGVVLRAFDEKLHRMVAIKMLAPAYAAIASARKRFIREARAAAAVKNEHVVAIYDVKDEHQPPYLVMELVDGISLQDKLDKHGPLGVKEVLRIGMQAAEGLAAAHKQGLVHRDIKPANILLENGVERVKITDFGLARAVDDASVTQSGTVTGTPMFMSPEQAEGRAVDHRSDLFSLGSVLYALCAGHPPFRATGTHAVLKRVIDEQPRPLRDVNPDMPPWLCDIIAKLHAKTPAERFESAKEVADLLSQHLAHLQGQAAAPARVKAPKSEIATTPGEGVREVAGGMLTGVGYFAVFFVLCFALYWPLISFTGWRLPEQGWLGCIILGILALGVWAVAALARRLQWLRVAGGLGYAAAFIALLGFGLGLTWLRNLNRQDGSVHVEIADPQVSATIDGPGFSWKSNPGESSSLRSPPGFYTFRVFKDNVLVNERHFQLRAGEMALLEAIAPQVAPPAKNANAKAPPAAAPEMADQVLPALAGNWNAEFTQKVLDGQPNEKRTSGVGMIDWVAGKRFLRQRMHMGSGGDLQLMTFDADSGVFRSWLFNAFGVNLGPSSGRWDKDTHTVTWTNLPEAGKVAVKTLRFIDGDNVTWDIIFRDKSGAIEFSGGGKMTRTSEKVDIPEDVASIPVPREMAILDRLVGDWRTNGEHKSGAGRVKFVNRLVSRKVLGGRAIASQESGVSGYLEMYGLATFDVKEKAYRNWTFHSDGKVTELGGHWDEAAQQLKWSSSLPESTSLAVWEWPNADTRRWTLLTRDRADNLIVDIQATNVRDTTPEKVEVMTALPEQPDEVLRYFVGVWKVDTTINDPKLPGTTASSLQSFELVAGGKYLRGLETATGQLFEMLSVETWDPEEQHFQGWQFRSDGVTAGPAQGTWNAASHTLTYKASWDDVQATLAIKIVSGSKVSAHGIERGVDGRIVREMDQTMTRLDEPVEITRMPGDPNRPPGMKVLDRVLGDWRNYCNVKTAEKPNEPQAMTALLRTRSVLGGRMIECQETNEMNGEATYWLTAFDPKLNKYRFWHFSPLYGVAAFPGTWDEAKKTMTWGTDDHTLLGRWIFKSDDEREIPYKVLDTKGNVQVWIEGVSRRINTKPFVVIPKGQASRQGFDNLRDAVAAADAGATVEIHGDGPFISNLVRIKKPLRIQAAAGYRPVITFQHAPLDRFWVAMIEAGAPLVLEGIEFRYERPAEGGVVQMINVKSDLRMTNCRLAVRGDANAIYIGYGSVELHRCEVLTQAWSGVRWNFEWEARLLISDSVIAGPDALVLHAHALREKYHDLDVRFLRSTLVGGRAAMSWLIDHVQPRNDGKRKPIRVHAADSVFALFEPDPMMVSVNCNVVGDYEDAGKVKAVLENAMSWSEDRNLYPEQPRVGLINFKTGALLSGGVLSSGIDDWRRFWNLPEVKSTAGEARLEGGNVFAKVQSNLHAIAPADFRLAADSPGQGLGADVDLLGPGAGYERFRNTPAYRVWFEGTTALLAVD